MTFGFQVGLDASLPATMCLVRFLMHSYAAAHVRDIRLICPALVWK
jgi:hypothetical protein